MASVVEGGELACISLQAGFRRAPLVMVFSLLRGGFCRLCMLCTILVLFLSVVPNSLLS
jgi:hypothetical protein